jgi:hypothetical protein
MNNDVWRQQLSENWCPAWPCSSCGNGTLSLIKDSLKYQETIESVKSHNVEGFDADWVVFVFTAWAQCQSCKQEYAISGTGGVAPEMTSDTEWDYQNYFQPKVCSPMPDIFQLPEKCPDDIAEDLRAAFAVFWINRSACAGRVRVGLEHLMTHLGIPNEKTGADGKVSELTLHARIDLFTKKESTLGSLLMALKWLGNTGSHDSDVSKNDLLAAFEVMEHALKELIGGHSKKIAELAKNLTEKHASKTS